MKSYYKPIGDEKQGFKLTIPARAKTKMAELYHCEVKEDGTLVYVPVVHDDPAPARLGVT